MPQASLPFILMLLHSPQSMSSIKKVSPKMTWKSNEASLEREIEQVK
jgi:hypothetical protein